MSDEFRHHDDIQEAQEYLTVVKDGEKQLIVGIDYLSENHCRREIIGFLVGYFREKEKLLRELIMGKKCNSQIDETVATISGFRWR